MLRSILALFIMLATSVLLSAQNRAPSCWLNYTDNFKGDIIMNTVRVANPSPLYTYYCTMQWNAGQEAGGYCGMQEHPDGRNFIFSIWDPIASNEAIKAAYVGPGTQVANFGGEGTGLRSLNFSLPWETIQWYTLVSRAWDYRGHTHFGYWVFDHEGEQWHHLVTMDFPVEGVRFNTGTGSFIEDWLGNGHLKRSVHHREGWKRGSGSKRWRAWESARFSRVSPDQGAANHINKYDGGIAANSYYFMSSGGSSSPVTNTSGSTLRLNNTENSPQMDTIRIQDFQFELNGQELRLEWEANLSSSPQFGFEINLLNKDLGDSLFYQSFVTVPHQRLYGIDLSSYPSGNYQLQFQLIDIFDQPSQLLTESLTIEATGIDKMPTDPENYWFVEHQSLYFPATKPSVSYEILDLNGRVLKRGPASGIVALADLPSLVLVLIKDTSNGSLISAKKLRTR